MAEKRSGFHKGPFLYFGFTLWGAVSYRDCETGPVAYEAWEISKSEFGNRWFAVSVRGVSLKTFRGRLRRFASVTTALRVARRELLRHSHG